MTPAAKREAPGTWAALLRGGPCGNPWGCRAWRSPSAWGRVGYLARLVRASMLEVLGENRIRTARAYGLPEHGIVDPRIRDDL